jgi:vacuolar-type H+-ATPase subunit H
MIDKEKIIIRNGTPVYAISLKDKKSSQNCNSSHIFIENGKLYFSDSSYYSASEFDFSNESHRIAKELFVAQIQVDIKRRVLELKQLEAIFNDIGLSECLGDSIQSNAKLLAEVKQEIENAKTEAINEFSEKTKNTEKKAVNTVKKEIEKINKDINEAVSEAVNETVSKKIDERVRPIALKKKDK